jgi:hypothetical protein
MKNMKLGSLRLIISKLISEVGEESEVWLSSDEEGNDFLPMSANIDLSIAYDEGTKRVIFFPIHC